jgi:hypothetical protein
MNEGLKTTSSPTLARDFSSPLHSPSNQRLVARKVRLLFVHCLSMILSLTFTSLNSGRQNSPPRHQAGSEDKKESDKDLRRAETAPVRTKLLARYAAGRRRSLANPSISCHCGDVTSTANAVIPLPLQRPRQSIGPRPRRNPSWRFLECGGFRRPCNGQVRGSGGEPIDISD